MSEPNVSQLIEHRNLRFILMDAPNDDNLVNYLSVMQKRNVTDIVRACEATYAQDEATKMGITCHDMEFQDGDPPPMEIIEKWLALVNQSFPRDGDGGDKTIAVHCIAGLGRAPMLVTIALMENGLTCAAAVGKIREARRGALNNRQLKFLQTYTPRKKGGTGCCTIM